MRRRIYGIRRHVNGSCKPVTSEVTFIPEKSNGKVTVSFTFDASVIKKTTDLVVFETLYRDNVEIAVHADIDDEGQTVSVIPPAPPVPQTGDESNLGFWIGLGAIALPVELYKLCISLQNTFSHDLSRIFAGTQSLDLAGQSTSVLQGSFAVSAQINFNLFNLLALIAFAYCVIKIFFANIKRGGILLIQMAVGSLYMFSVPRGYADGFNQWMKQVAAICLTAFMQTTLLYLGLLTFPGNMLLGLGIMLAANEVPRIAQQFGLDSSVKVNMMSVVHATTTAVNLTRSVARATGK